VSPLEANDIVVAMHRPPVSLPRVYSASTSLSKLMKRDDDGGKTFASPRLVRYAS